MKLNDLAEALVVLHDHGLDEIDVLVLDEVARIIKDKSPATIMRIVDSSAAASPATVHARIKKLCDKNVLKKVTSSDNLRYKTLEFGPAYHKAIDQLSRV